MKINGRNNDVFASPWLVFYFRTIKIKMAWNSSLSVRDIKHDLRVFFAEKDDREF